MRTILKIFMMLFCVFSYAQTTVNGSVTDVNSQPLSGATVMIVGSSTGRDGIHGATFASED